MSRTSLVGAVLCTALAATSAGASTFTVNLPGDPNVAPPPGFHTLRTAISAANGNPGPDTIVFALGSVGSAQTIAVTSGLPAVTGAVLIDGWSQGGAGYTGAPLVTIDGSSAPNSFGLNLQGANVTVRGLALVSFPVSSGNGFGIGIFGAASEVWIHGCTLAGNGQGGLWVGPGVGPVLVGTNADGTNDAAERNVIYGNGSYGVLISSRGATLAGNYVGLQADGSTAGPQTVGVSDSAGGALIGGRIPAARNVIAASAFAGLLLQGADSVVAGNYIGLAADGLTARPNATGVDVEASATGVRLGTDGDGLGDAFERNVISGNTGVGVVVYSSASLVAGNYIGLAADGLLDRGNGLGGLQVRGEANQVGGLLPAQRNVISGNTQQGLRVTGSSNVIQGNYVGTSASGLVAVPNDGGGVALSTTGGGGTIGGSAAGAGNVISGNGAYGLAILDVGGHTVRGNLIGVGPDGVTALGNVPGPGIQVSGNGGNAIGGLGAGDGNVVAYNGGGGILVSVGSANSLGRNQVFSNGALGIDLGANGVSPNDAGDGDAGPNNLQNFPALTYASSDGGSVTVEGALDGQPGNFRLEFFASPLLDPSGHGEGQLFVGAATVASGTPFNLVFPAAVPKTWFLTATATDAAGNTSEFSPGMTLEPWANLELTMADSPDPVPPGTPLVYTLTVGNLGPSPATGVRVVDALPSGVSLVQTAGCAEDPVGLPQCTLGFIAAGQQKSFTIQVSVQPSPPPSAMNVAVVTANELDPFSSNNSASATTWLVPAADLAVLVSDGSASAVAGQPTTYGIVVTNAGPSAVTGARVQDAFPEDLTCAWTCGGLAGGVCPAAGNGAIDVTVDLPVGASANFTAVCQLASSLTGTLTNTARVSVPVGSYDPATANDTSSDSDDVLVQADLDLSQADSPDPAPVFGQVTYVLQVANAGPSDSAGLTVNDTLPPGTTLVSSTPSCALAANQLGCTLGPLAAGASAQVTVVVQADPGTIGPVTNLASVGGLDPDPNSANDTSSEVTTLAFRKGDLDNDLQTDLLFRHLPDGHHAAWLMNGVTRQSVADVSPDPDALDWQVAGVDDFDGDHRNDLVLWHAGTGQVEFWLLGGPSGTTRQGAAVPLTGASPLALDWKLAATADFTFDGHPDLVWRNQISQNIVIWKMGEGGAPGTEKTGAIVPVPAQAVNANWEIVGARDFDGDDATDLLWYNSTSGKIVQWLMDASVQRLTGRFTVPANAGDANWKVLAAGDFGAGAGGVANSNDVLWRNANSGKLVVWHLDLAGHRTAGTFTNPDGPPDPATDWTVAGPR